MRYVDYDYEAEFDKSLDHADNEQIEKLLSVGKIKSVYTTKTVKAGDQFEVEIYPAFTRKEIDKHKIKKKNYQAQKNLNDKNARKRVERLINTNFTDGDLWVTLTYDQKHLPQSMDEALKNMKNYIRRINYNRKKLGLDKAKYIYVTEFNENKKIRCHHHLIMDGGLTMDLVEKLWTCGKRNNVRKVSKDDDEGLTGLAGYLVKDPSGKKRWCSSLNLKKPEESKSYTAFSSSKVRKMVEDEARIKGMLEKRYKRDFIRAEIKFNEFNKRFYIYARMKQRCNQ